jgi:hypothetical protein
MAHDVFVSYSAKDKPTADAVCATLEAKGIRCWVAPRDILPGMDWGEAIIDAINSSRVIVLVFSSNANESRQIKREVERAVNKGIPIIPFRIENVPLSKSLEYFISSPHWLDAITPPMEQHLQYLGDTVNLLIQRMPPATPEQAMSEVYSPEPVRQKRASVQESKTSNYLLIGAACFIGFLLLLGLIAAVVKYMAPDKKDDTVATTEEGERDQNSSQVGVSEQLGGNPSQVGVADSRVDANLVGAWKTSVVIDGLRWDLLWEIFPTGKFKFLGTTSNAGRFQAGLGRWTRTSTTISQTDYGTYSLLNPTSLSFTGLAGTALFTKMNGTNSNARSVVDPALLGKWQSDIVAKGVPLKIYFEVFGNGTYRTTIVNEDSGTIEATNGSWKETSNKLGLIQGTYNVITPNSISFTGPAGTAIWNRSMGSGS